MVQGKMKKLRCDDVVCALLLGINSHDLFVFFRGSDGAYSLLLVWCEMQMLEIVDAKKSSYVAANQFHVPADRVRAASCSHLRECVGVL